MGLVQRNEMSCRGPFVVADLNVQGELQLQETYAYQELEQIPGASDLIAHFAASIWSAPEEFEIEVLGATSNLRMRWRASAETAGIATLRSDEQLASLSLLASGLDSEADRLHARCVSEASPPRTARHGVEPAFALMDLKQRPLVATINFKSPQEPADQLLTALADRCFAAAYFRKLGLV